jgi:hypothetical protein
MTKLRLTRTARGAVVAVALALLWAAPAAAAQPTRTVTHLRGDRVGHFPAGTGCTFDVTVYVNSRAQVTVTEFSDGSTVYEVHSMKRAITNDATGVSFVENQQYHDREWIDPATGWIRGVTSGQSIQQFYPGDVGPYGIVEQPAAYVIYGTTWWAWDPATEHETEFTWTGTLTDICAAIS